MTYKEAERKRDKLRKKGINAVIQQHDNGYIVIEHNEGVPTFI